MLAATDQHRTRQAALEVLVANLPAVLAGRDVDADRIFVVHLHAIRAGVHPIAVGVAHDDEIVRADVAAAVLFVHPRHRKLVEIDRVFAIDVLEYRSAFDHPMRDRCVRLHAVAIGAHEFHRRLRLGQVHRERDALG